MTDPYSVLGITPGADDETIKKAYRQKCKQYHPDLHPDDPAAEEHFKEVQAAYSEIMRIKQGGGTAYRQSGQTYGQSSGYSQQYQDPFAGGGFGFGPFGFGYYSTGSSAGRQSYGSAAGDPELRAAANYIRSGFYEEALNTLNGISASGRTAQWHYYAALANQGLGNNIRAQEEARTGFDGAKQLRLSESAGPAAKSGPQLHKLPTALRPAQRPSRAVLPVVLDVPAGLQHPELVLLRRTRRVLYLLIP